MYINKISISNFKSIEKAEMDLSQLTMLVGKNASGKSNIINVFRFIADILSDGIDHAIAKQGGIHNITNANLPKGEKVEIAFAMDLSNDRCLRRLASKRYALNISSVEYKFVLQPNQRGHGYHIIYDYIQIINDCYLFAGTKYKKPTFSPLNMQRVITIERKNKNNTVKVDKNMLHDNPSNDLLEQLEKDPALDFFVLAANQDKQELMLYRLPVLLSTSFAGNSFIRVFDFDPKTLKKSSSMAHTRVFYEDGSNLASILQTILNNKEQRKKLTILLNEYLPFVEAVTIENNPDKSFSYKIRECYSKKAFHANFLSDGTVSLLALIIALYFHEESNIIVLEEPERNIHPKLLSTLLASATDVSQEKQIIITTHNPEFLRHANIENVRLVSRSATGRTKISNPSNNATVKIFLENDLGLDDLFVDDLMEDKQ